MSEIHRLASRGDPFALRTLLEEGADPNERLAPADETPLMCAASKRRRTNIKVLVSFGADLTLRDIRGNTALHHSVTTEVARVLLELGADPDADRVKGSTTAALWAEAGHIRLAQLLVEFGADQEARGTGGQTVRDMLSGPNIVVDGLAAMAGAREDDKHVAKYDASIRKESADLTISPEEYVSLHRHILLWSLHTDVYSDPNLQTWAQGVRLLPTYANNVTL